MTLGEHLMLSTLAHVRGLCRGYALAARQAECRPLVLYLRRLVWVLACWLLLFFSARGYLQNTHTVDRVITKVVATKNQAWEYVVKGVAIQWKVRPFVSRQRPPIPEVLR
jgi:hypothetical protein